jgi:hypothetical protein
MLPAVADGMAIDFARSVRLNTGGKLVLTASR